MTRTDLEGFLARHHDAQARRRAETFLGRGDNNINAPIIEPDLLARYRAHAV